MAQILTDVPCADDGARPRADGGAHEARARAGTLARAGRRAQDRPMASWLWIVIAAAVAVIWLIGLIDIFRRKLGTKRTVAWVLIVLLVPVLGTILYWVLRTPDAREVQGAADAQRDVRRARHDRPADSTRFGP
jgi:hypothetical protein